MNDVTDASLKQFLTNVKCINISRYFTFIDQQTDRQTDRYMYTTYIHIDR